MTIKQVFLRLLIGVLLPILFFMLSIFLEIFIKEEEIKSLVSSLIFILTYGLLVMSIPLFGYSLLMNSIVIPKFYHCTLCVMIFSGFLGMLFPLIPMWIGGSFDLIEILRTFIVGLIVGYILKTIYPKNTINRGKENDSK